ncbi:hypothetical protein C8Q76DRAFT_802577 [Earliella scabrosa]|nr:hypothetical protein C8Q76DRAFT_802577 [Earliella scabrosa]
MSRFDAQVHTQYFKVASLALAMLEILLTLPDEVRFSPLPVIDQFTDLVQVTYMWSSRLSPMKVMYFVNKYTVILDAILSITTAMWIRDPAFNKYVQGIVVVGYIELAGFSVYIVCQTLVWTEYPFADSLHIVGCVPYLQDQDLWPAYGCLMIGETVIVILTILRQYLDSADQELLRRRCYEESGDNTQPPTSLYRCCAVSMKSILVDTLYRDGIHFYCIVLSITIVNVLVMLSGPEGLTSLMQIFLRVIHSALCTRVLLNLRIAAKDIGGASACDPYGTDTKNTTLYFKVASLALAIWEILCTLPDEVAHMWSAGLSPTKVVYFINKYSVLVDLLLAISIVLWTVDPEICERHFQALAYCYLIAILAMRTIVLWSRNPYVKFLVIGAYLEFVPFALYCVWQTLFWTEYPSRDVLRITGCVPSAQDRDAWPAYGCLILGETGIIVLTILRRYLNSVEDESPSESPKRFESQVTRALHRCYTGSTENVLVQTVYRDGIHFYFIFLGITTVNVLVMLLGPEGLTSAMQMPLRVVHSALCTRVLLNLRKAAKDVAGSGAWDTDGAAESKITTLAFAPGPAASRSREVDAEVADLQRPTVGPSRDSDGGSTLGV